MPKKIFVQSVYPVHLKKTGEGVCKFLPNKEGKINRTKDTIAIIADMSGIITLTL